MRHATSRRREQREIGASLLLQFELALDNRFPDLVIRDRQRFSEGGPSARDLPLTPLLQLLWRCCVVSMTSMII
jgi:hypothetical protein